MNKHLKVACKAKVMRTALGFALIVGPILVGINHGDTILAGSMTDSDWLKCALTMIVPYTVSTLSSISAYHQCNKSS